MRNRTPHVTAKYLSVAAVAAELSMSRQGALNKLSKGEIPGGEVAYIDTQGKRRWRVDAQAFFAWREEMRASSKRQPMRPLVYFIQHQDAPDDPVKIGYSSDHFLEERLATLQIGNPRPLCVLATVNGGQEKEFELHQRFRRLRIRGEWFAMSDELRELIQAAQLSPVDKSRGNP